MAKADEEETARLTEWLSDERGGVDFIFNVLNGQLPMGT